MEYEDEMEYEEHTEDEGNFSQEEIMYQNQEEAETMDYAGEITINLNKYYAIEQMYKQMEMDFDKDDYFKDVKITQRSILFGSEDSFDGDFLSPRIESDCSIFVEVYIAFFYLRTLS